MSLASWKKEFYPIKANMVSKENALEHSLKKWEGLTKKNLKKHKVLLSRGGLFDENYDELWIDSDCCALCFHYARNDCEDCPLTKLRNRYRCDDTKDTEKISPYAEMVNHGNVKPMLNLLRKAIREEKKGKT